MNFKLSHLSLCFLLIGILSCKKNAYFHDSGTHEADYDGSVFEYLQNHKYHQFDSLCKVIQLAGLEDVFHNESITFFAPADTTIKRTIQVINRNFYNRGKDTITSLHQLSSKFWKKQLSYYLFKGERRLKDYPQIDPGLIQTFPGQFYDSYQGKKMLIGVIFNSAGGVQYAGYRQIIINYFSGVLPPTGVLSYANLIATSDIHPKNGIIHALQYSNLNTSTGYGLRSNMIFGFSEFDVIADAEQIGIK